MSDSPVNARRRRQALVAGYLFVNELDSVLPAAAFKELKRSQVSKVEGWAKKWRVHAPCVLDAAREFLEYVQDRSHSRTDWRMFTGFGIRYYGVVPRVALRTLRELDARPFNSACLGDPDAATEDDALAPMSACPFSESFAQFIDRAERHWKARVAHFKELGIARVTLRDNLERDVRWCVLFQVCNRHPAQIARDYDQAVEPTAVYQAIRRIADLIQLNLRSIGPRGGARRRRDPAAPRKQTA
jgi:hypothetical protein